MGETGRNGPVEIDAQDGVIRRLDKRRQPLSMILPKRLNGGTYALLQPLRQAAQYAGPLGLAAFGATGIEGILHAPGLSLWRNNYRPLGSGEVNRLRGGYW
jgi:hypothetical protein